jgi:hypothetical protein
MRRISHRRRGRAGEVQVGRLLVEEGLQDLVIDRRARALEARAWEALGRTWHCRIYDEGFCRSCRDDSILAQILFDLARDVTRTDYERLSSLGRTGSLWGASANPSSAA